MAAKKKPEPEPVETEAMKAAREGSMDDAPPMPPAPPVEETA